MSTRTINIEAVKRLLSIDLNKDTVRGLTVNPATRIIDLDSLSVDDLMEFFKTLHSQEWARRNIVGNDDKQEAAEWFLKELSRFHSFLLQKKAKESTPHLDIKRLFL